MPASRPTQSCVTQRNRQGLRDEQQKSVNACVMRVDQFKQCFTQCVFPPTTLTSSADLSQSRRGNEKRLERGSSIARPAGCRCSCVYLHADMFLKQADQIHSACCSKTVAEGWQCDPGTQKNKNAAQNSPEAVRFLLLD